MTLNKAIGIIIAFIVLAAITFGVVMFVKTKFFPSRKVVTSTNGSIQNISSVPATESAQVYPQGSGLPSTGSNVNVAAGMKVYQLDNVSFKYPQNWGLLTCTNSRNFELDPTSSADQKVACDRAQKPITVVVDNNVGCQGQTITLGGTQVVKSRVENARGVDYRWCFNVSGKSFNLTHRVSPTPSQGLSKDDYAGQIEQMIANIAPRGGS